MGTFIKLILKPGKEKSVLRMHPWIFSGAVKNIEGTSREGDIAEVFSSDHEFLALGHYQIGSIAVRIFSFEKLDPDLNFWKQKIITAYELRKKLRLIGNDNNNVYRLVNGEGDGMPGLIIDYYNGVVVLQMHSIGMYLLRELLVTILQEIFHYELIAVFDKSKHTLPYKTGLHARNEFLLGSQALIEVIENGCRFNVDISSGQKTGFFIDQRDNRELLLKYVKDRDVLNMFCYTGGFSVYALKGGAAKVHSVDTSDQAVELTNNNINLNFNKNRKHQSFSADAFTYLNNIKDLYDVIIVDPPAFAKHQDAISNALQGYKRLNAKAIEQIRSGGILFTFSCSQVVSKEDFRKSVFAAAANTGRNVRILHQLAQPPDHPVSIYHPEGEYLKGLVIYID
jgi:23S rRNA (cytosine1962-C5)-methyltransferase